MSQVVRIDDEAYEYIKEHWRAAEPAWKAVRRALGLDVPEDTSCAGYEARVRKSRDSNMELSDDRA